MRGILVDWMMEVCCEFHFKRETFYLAVCYVDLYLSKAEPILK
jgi:cyclin E